MNALNDGQSSEQGRVVARHSGAIEIVIMGGDSCAGCRLCRREEGNSMRLEVEDKASLEIGQAVRVSLPYSSQWRPAFYVFVAPLAFFFAGGVACGTAARYFGARGPLEILAAAAGAFLGVAVSLWLARSADRRFRSEVFSKTIVEPLEPAESETG